MYQLIPFAVSGELVDGNIINREIDLKQLSALVAPLGMEIKGIDGAVFAGKHLLLCPDGYLRNVSTPEHLDYRLREMGAPDSSSLKGRVRE